MDRTVAVEAVRVDVVTVPSPASGTPLDAVDSRASFAKRVRAPASISDPA